MRCLVAQSCQTLCAPMDCSWPGSSVHGDSSGKNTTVGYHPPGDLPNPGVEPKSLAMQEDFLPAEPPGKPMNTAVGSLFLLQGIFLTQEPNQCLLHCRQIIYQLSYQGIKKKKKCPFSPGRQFLRNNTKLKNLCTTRYQDTKDTKSVIFTQG